MRADLEAERREFKKLVAGQVDLITAIEKWFEWCDGGEDINDQGTLWKAMRAAWERYRTLGKPS